MSWTFGLCALDGTDIGAIHRAYDRRLALPLNGLSTASVKLRLDDSLVDEIISRDGDVLLKVYRDSTLEFEGDLLTVEEATEGEGPPTVVCNFVGPLWRLQKRLMGKSSTGTSYADTQRNTIVNTLVTEANAEKDTGIRIGTFESLDPVSAGPWTYKPVSEAISELVTAKAPLREAWEDWETIGSSGVVTGRSLRIGGTWAGAEGNENDFYVLEATAPGNAAYRDVISDAGDQQNGRVIVASGTAGMTDTFAQIVFAHNTFAVSGVTAQSGLSLRYTDQYNQAIINVYRAVPSGQIVIQVLKVVSGTLSVVDGYSSANTFDANTGYRLSAQIDSSGVYRVWFTHSDYVGLPSTALEGTEADFASTGALPSGKVGIHDWYPNTTACTRSYDVFNVYDPTSTPVSLDFEFVPSEPTADSNQSGVVGAGLKLWTMNVYDAMGDVTNAIFEFGGGSHSAKSYHRALSREGLLTQGYVLPSDIENEQVASASDTAAVTARGLYQEVIPSDVGDYLLREVLAEAHVSVRKQARQLIRFEPSDNAPEYGVDYNVGDYVIGRATYDGSVRFNATFRVYGVDIAIDDNGKETIVPSLVPSD